MGLTFKENCPDLRNTKAVDIVQELKEFGVEPDVCDPWVSAKEAQHEYGITPIVAPENGQYAAVIIAVSHDEFKKMGAAGMKQLIQPTSVIYDLKYVLSAEDADIRL